MPFYHSNIDFDEVLFYHRGNFFSRDGIDAGALTFHPQGIHHGPHPNAYKAASDKTFTDEFAVMIDARRPLMPTKYFSEIENRDYWQSWMPKGVRMLSFATDGDFTANYKFLIGCVVPRPIAFVSTLNEDGSNNVAPFSFFTAVSAKPMVIAFCPLIRSSTGTLKDTPRNIVREGEFVVNFVTEENYKKVHRASAELPYGEDEFLYAGLAPLDSECVRAKRVAESPVHFECLLRDRLDYGDKPGQGQIITGEVVRVHVDEKLYQNGRIDTDVLAPIGRGAGNDWIRCTDRIELERLSAAQIQK